MSQNIKVSLRYYNKDTGACQIAQSSVSIPNFVFQSKLNFYPPKHIDDQARELLLSFIIQNKFLKGDYTYTFWYGSSTFIGGRTF